MTEFLADHQGKRSGTRLMSFMCLLTAIALAVWDTLTVQVDVSHFVTAFLLAATGGKLGGASIEHFSQRASE